MLKVIQNFRGVFHTNAKKPVKTTDDIYKKLRTSRLITEYIFHISEKNRYLYVETAKVGCSTIKSALQLIEAGSSETQNDPHDRISSPLLKPSQAGPLFLDALYSDTFFRFCFVRNPYARVLSCYIDKLYNKHVPKYINNLGLNPLVNQRQEKPFSGLSFLEFLNLIDNQKHLNADVHWMPQFSLLSPDIVDYNFIGRFENFSADLQRVGRVIGWESPDVVAPHYTGAEHRIHEFYGPEEIKLVSRIYSMDFDKFLYSRDVRLV